MATSVMTPLDLSRSQLEGVLLAHPAKKRPLAPKTIKTMMSNLTICYAHINGDSESKPNNFGDLTYLTLNALKHTKSKSTKYKALYKECCNETQTKILQSPKNLIDSCRSVLYSVTQHLRTLDNADEFKTLIDKYTEALTALHTEFMRLQEENELRQLTRARTAREEKSWVDWDALCTRMLATNVFIERALAGENDDINERRIPAVKELQSALLAAFYVMLPPVRNNYDGLRFVEYDGAYDASSGLSFDEYLDVTAKEHETMTRQKSPNYILAPKDGPLVLVLNKFKTDERTSAEHYNRDLDFILDHDKQIRIVLDSNPVMEKFGFDPKRLGGYLRKYRDLKLFANRNPDELLFYDVEQRRPGVTPPPAVKRITEEATKSRLLRFTGKMNNIAQTAASAVGEQCGGAPEAKIATKMFRKLFLTWFHEQDPTNEERIYIAKGMGHSAATALKNYTKDKKRSLPTDEGPAPKRVAA